jgi:septal ring factor EnvC (AmiA/AmiB activator)
MSDELRRTNVLLEELMSQFRAFGEGLQQLNDKMDIHLEENRKEFKMVHNSLDRNHQEHQLLKQMVDDLNSDIKRLDSEVVQIKRVK